MEEASRKSLRAEVGRRKQERERSQATTVEERCAKLWEKAENEIIVSIKSRGEKIVPEERLEAMVEQMLRSLWENALHQYRLLMERLSNSLPLVWENEQAYLPDDDMVEEGQKANAEDARRTFETIETIFTWGGYVSSETAHELAVILVELEGAR